MNPNTPAELCSVQYADFDQAICICLRNFSINGMCYLAKSNAKSAFRVLGLNPQSWKWLVLKAISHFDGKVYYFIDKCLPFGSSISCALFQKVSDALAWLVEFATKTPLVNYLDNFLFAAWLRAVCNDYLRTFLRISEQICLPISKEKTRQGFLVDAE